MSNCQSLLKKIRKIQTLLASKGAPMGRYVEGYTDGIYDFVEEATVFQVQKTNSPTVLNPQDTSDFLFSPTLFSNIKWSKHDCEKSFNWQNGIKYTLSFSGGSPSVTLQNSLSFDVELFLCCNFYDINEEGEGQDLFCEIGKGKSKTINLKAERTPVRGTIAVLGIRFK